MNVRRQKIINMAQRKYQEKMYSFSSFLKIHGDINTTINQKQRTVGKQLNKICNLLFIIMNYLDFYVPSPIRLVGLATKAE